MYSKIECLCDDKCVAGNSRVFDKHLTEKVWTIDTHSIDEGFGIVGKVHPFPIGFTVDHYRNVLPIGRKIFLKYLNILEDLVKIQWKLEKNLFRDMPAKQDPNSRRPVLIVDFKHILRIFSDRILVAYRA
jgi:hypothetical protein